MFECGLTNRVRRVLLAVALHVLLLAATPRVVGQYPRFPVVVQPGTQSWPATDGKTITWYDDRSGESDIYAYDVSTGLETPICVAPGMQRMADVSGDYIVWQDRRSGQWDIYGYDLRTGREFPICTHSGDQHFPRVSGSFVVWADWRRDSPLDVDIYGYHIGTGLEVPICTVDGHQNLPVIDGNIVVWEDSRNGRRDLYAYDLAGGGESEVSVKSNAWHFQPEISGNTVVWMDDSDATAGVFALDLASGTETRVATPPSRSKYYHPAVSGSLMVWTELGSGRDDYLHGFNLATGERFLFADDIEGLDPVDLGGTLAVFAVVDAEGRYWDVHAMYIPEPATLALLGLGAAGVLRRRRRGCSRRGPAAPGGLPGHVSDDPGLARGIGGLPQRLPQPSWPWGRPLVPPGRRQNGATP